MKLILVDDNVAFRQGLREYLENELGHEVIAEVGSGEEFLALKNKIWEADIVLMDIVMEGLNGIQTTKAVLEDIYRLKVVAITLNIEDSYLVEFVEAGFKGFINKNEIFKTLEPTLHNVMCGRYIFPPELKIVNGNIQ